MRTSNPIPDYCCHLWSRRAKSIFMYQYLALSLYFFFLSFLPLPVPLSPLTLSFCSCTLSSLYFFLLFSFFLYNYFLSSFLVMFPVTSWCSELRCCRYVRKRLQHSGMCYVLWYLCADISRRKGNIHCTQLSKLLSVKFDVIWHLSKSLCRNFAMLRQISV